MSLSDPVADMLTKIRNASSARFESVDIPTSKLKLEITKILKNEGYIKTFKKVTQDGRNLIRIFLKYDGQNEPVIHGLKRISTPGPPHVRRLQDASPGAERIRDAHRHHLPRRHHGQEGPGEEGRWRAALHHLVSKENAVSRIGRLPGQNPQGSQGLPPGRPRAPGGPQGQGHPGVRPRGLGEGGGRLRGRHRASTTRSKAKSLHGLYRNLLKNALIGLSDGLCQDAASSPGWATRRR